MLSGEFLDDTSRHLHMGWLSAHRFTCCHCYEMRFFRALLYFIVGVLLAAYCEFTYAASIAPTSTYYYGTYLSTQYTSTSLACAQYQATVSSNNAPLTASFLSATPYTTPNVWVCNWRLTGNRTFDGPFGTAILGGNCITGYVYNSTTAMCDFSACPTGQSLVNGVCVAGNTCNLAAGTVISSGYYDLGATQTPIQTPPITLCAQNCYVTFSGNSPYANLVSGVEHIYAKGNYSVSATGSAGYCATNSPTSSTSSAGSTLPFPSCGTGKSVAYVNGKAICYANSTSTTTPPPVTSSSSTTTGTNAQGQATSTTTTTNSDGSTTTSTTTTTPTGTTTSTTTTQPAAADKATFCSANPTDPSCATRDPCLDNPNRIGCMDAGASPIEEPAQITKNLSFSPINIAQNPTCPAPQVINVFAHQMTIPFDPICNYADGIRPVLLAFAYLWAAYIILGAMKDG